MLVFLIPIKSYKIANSWIELSKMIERCLGSVCNQTSLEFKVIVVCHERPDINFYHPVERAISLITAYLVCLIEYCPMNL